MAAAHARPYEEVVAEPRHGRRSRPDRRRGARTSRHATAGTSWRRRSRSRGGVGSSTSSRTSSSSCCSSRRQSRPRSGRSSGTRRCPTRQSPSSRSCCSTRPWATSRRRAPRRPSRPWADGGRRRRASIRDGEQRSVPAAELVPGDVILIEEGDTIPADARLIQTIALKTAEAALTGESLPVAKDVAPIQRSRRSAIGTTWSSAARPRRTGAAAAVVAATGMQTELGRIAGMLKRPPGGDDAAAEGARPRRAGSWGVVVAIAVVMIATMLVVEDVRGRRRIFDVLILGVALAVAAVPEGLPAVVTAVLSLGVQRMARRHAIVRHLARSRRWARQASSRRTRPAR